MAESSIDIIDSLLASQRDAFARGLRPEVTDLLSGSGFENDRDARLDLLYHEFVLLEEAGERPDSEAYASRYPDLADDLRMHFEVHQAVVEQALLNTGDGEFDVTWPARTPARRPLEEDLPNYENLEPIGEGGMATVYRARDRRLGRDVALKMFHPGRVPAARELVRFESEAGILARLSHPNILQIYEIGRWAELPFLALEYAPGGSLADRLQKLTLSPAAAARLVITLARAVAYAHGLKIVHRDLKPANILFALDQSPKIADFGLAKLLELDGGSRHDATRSGESVGTPRYMAPEQASGSRSQIGPRTDVYALGGLLYEALTGQAPFIGATVAETLRKITEDDPIPPRRLQPAVPRDLETICLCCLQKTPDLRYQSADALAADLERFLQNEPIAARPTPHWRRLAKWTRRNPWRAAIVTLGILLGVLLPTLGFFSVQKERRRVDGLRRDVAALVAEGQRLLGVNEPEASLGKFQEAWLKVQSEPQLVDHQPGVSGWLVHARRASGQQQWKRRSPPREFDDRRDEALLMSTFLPCVGAPEPIAVRAAIDDALSFTIQNDPLWTEARNELESLRVDVVERESGAEAAYSLLASLPDQSGRDLQLRRAALLRRLGRSDNARPEPVIVEAPPAEVVCEDLTEGVASLRQRQFAESLQHFDKVLREEPANFQGRLLQAAAHLESDQFRQAEVGLTACIAQRPQFAWAFVLRGHALARSGRPLEARQDYETALSLKLSDAARKAASASLNELEVEHRASQVSPNLTPMSEAGHS